MWFSLQVLAKYRLKQSLWVRTARKTCEEGIVCPRFWLMIILLICLLISKAFLYPKYQSSSNQSVRLVWIIYYCHSHEDNRGLWGVTHMRPTMGLVVLCLGILPLLYSCIFCCFVCFVALHFQQWRMYVSTKCQGQLILDKTEINQDNP